ncbi:hypothetical protein Mapa_002185 [Marchantia paleacea]|nr:hypothetical protein Mapa_002185 [Marchantia paleacea]
MIQWRELEHGKLSADNHHQQQQHQGMAKGLKPGLKHRKFLFTRWLRPVEGPGWKCHERSNTLNLETAKKSLTSPYDSRTV